MSSKDFKVIYLTGSPATGKSTLVRNLAQKISPLEVYTYSKILADYVGRKRSSLFSEDDMRSLSSKVILPEDVAAVDLMLLDYVNQNRHRSHIIIDSHAVTKEEYGFRVTPFSIKLLSGIRPSMIFVLYADPQVVRSRIKNNSQGSSLSIMNM